REEHQAAGMGRVADELLGAVDDVAVALLHRAGLQVGGVGTRLRLGQAEGADMFGRRQLPQPAVLLGVRPEIVDDDAGGGVVHADHRGDRAVTRGDLLQQKGIGDRVDLTAVPLRRGRRAEYAEFTQFTDDLRLYAQVLFALGGQRGQPLLREAADLVDDEGIAVGGNAVGHGGPPGSGQAVFTPWQPYGTRGDTHGAGGADNTKRNNLWRTGGIISS